MSTATQEHNNAILNRIRKDYLEVTGMSFEDYTAKRDAEKWEADVREYATRTLDRLNNRPTSFVFGRLPCQDYRLLVDGVVDDLCFGKLATDVKDRVYLMLGIAG